MSKKVITYRGLKHNLKVCEQILERGGILDNKRAYDMFGTDDYSVAMKKVDSIAISLAYKHYKTIMDLMKKIKPLFNNKIKNVLPNDAVVANNIRI